MRPGHPVLRAQVLPARPTGAGVEAAPRGESCAPRMGAGKSQPRAAIAVAGVARSLSARPERDTRTPSIVTEACRCPRRACGTPSTAGGSD
jgi:hypothetical protein